MSLCGWICRRCRLILEEREMELISTGVTAWQRISTCPDACMSGQMGVGTSQSPSYRTAFPSFLNHQAREKKCLIVLVVSLYSGPRNA